MNVCALIVIFVKMYFMLMSMLAVRMRAAVWVDVLVFIDMSVFISVMMMVVGFFSIAECES